MDHFESGSGASEAENDPSAAENYFSAYHTPNFHHKYQLLPALKAKQRPDFGERYIPQRGGSGHNNAYPTGEATEQHLSSIETNKLSLIT